MSTTSQMYKTDLLTEIAHRANFTKGDVKLIWETLESILQEQILEKTNELYNDPNLMQIDVLDISGFLNINLRKTKSHRHWVELKKEWMILPDGYRLIMKPSRVLAKMVKEEAKDLTRLNGSAEADEIEEE
jgi:hypothetical protein